MSHIQMAYRFAVIGLMTGLMVTELWAGELIPALDDSTALKDYTAVYAGAADEINPDMTGGQITLAARFNPDSSQRSGGPYIILEIGGTSNGTGLYLADGHVVFVSRAGGFNVLPESMADTDFTAYSSQRTIAVELGPVSFGSENVVYASMDLAAGELVCGVNDVVYSYTVTNPADTNFDGNESICFLTRGSIVAGWMGGLHELSGSAFPLLYAGNAAGMTQTAGYENQRGQIFNTAVPASQPPYSILVTESDGTTAAAEGGAADSISIRLTEDPTDYPVMITLADASAPDQVQIAPSQIVFDTNNWQNAQSVTLTAVDDMEQEPRSHSALLQFQIQVNPASGYFGCLLEDLVVTVKENDCGFWGYDQVDTNQDCQIDLADLLNVAAAWLECTRPQAGCMDYRP